jgi:hypothetical protein
MTDFVIVAVAAATLATVSPSKPIESVVPQNAPTVGFIVYRDVAACEAAVTRLTAPQGRRFVCVPVESNATELATAY